MDEQFNKKRVFGLGEWLEKYLNPSIQLYEYRELAETVIQLCNLDFHLSEDDIMLQTIDYIGQQPIEVQEFVLNKKTIRNAYLRELQDRCFDGGSYCTGLIFLKDDFKSHLDKIELTDISKTEKMAKTVLLSIFIKLGELITSYQEKKEFEDDGNQEYSEDHWAKQEYIFEGWSIRNTQGLFDFQDSKEPNINLLRRIYSSNDSWELFFNNDSQLSLVEDWPTISILDFYNSISKEIVIENGKVKSKNIFSGLFEYTNLKGMPSCLPWAAIFSKIFLDFLRLGGEKYFIFCKHCGRFALSKRLKPDGNPEKIFCSAKCRTAYKRV